MGSTPTLGTGENMLDVATLNWIKKHIDLELNSTKHNEENFHKDEQELVLLRLKAIVDKEIINALSKPNQV